MKVKILQKKDGGFIRTGLVFKDHGNEINIFSDYDLDMTCAILKCFIEDKFNKVTEEYKE